MTWLEAEQPKLFAAVRQASAQGWDSLTWQLAEAPWQSFNRRSYWPNDWEETLELGLQAARRATDLAAEGQMLHHLGYVLRDRRCFAEATMRLNESLAIFRQLGDRASEGMALGTLGTTYRKQRQLREAIACYEQSLTVRRKVGDRRWGGTRPCGARRHLPQGECR